MEPANEWITLRAAHALLATSPLSRVSLRTLQRSLSEPARRAAEWERYERGRHGSELVRGWARRRGIARVEYMVSRAWVERKVREARES
jgi:hypothetical protein